MIHTMIYDADIGTYCSSSKIDILEKILLLFLIWMVGYIIHIFIR